MLGDLYKSFNTEDQARLLFVAVGKTNFRSMNRNFCRGPFPATDADTWWKEFGASQRSLVILRKSLTTGRWERSCSLSMDRHAEKVKEVIVELLGQGRSKIGSGAVSSDKTKTPTVPAVERTDGISIDIPPAVDIDAKPPTSACSAHPMCKHTAGECCPTIDGTMEGCCVLQAQASEKTPDLYTGGSCSAWDPCAVSRNAVCENNRCLCIGGMVSLHGKCVQEAEADFERVVGTKAELPAVSQPSIIADMADHRLRVAGLGSHTVSDDLMFPVLVTGFAVLMIVLVLLQRHWKATAIRKQG